MLFYLQHFTYQNWLWAFTNLFSRAIRLRSLKQGETLAMVPYADLINHSPFSQAYIDAREDGDWLFKSGNEEVILFADRGYRRMEQASQYCIAKGRRFDKFLTPFVTKSCRFTFRMDPSRTQSFYCCMALRLREILSILST